MTQIEELEDKSLTSSGFHIDENLDPDEVYDWVRPKIVETWRATKDSVFDTGKWLLAATKATEHGDWGGFVKTLPFNSSTAEKLRNIAACEVFQKPEIYEILPTSWGTLDVLRGYAEKHHDKFLKLVDEGKITTKISRKEARELFVSPNKAPLTETAPKSVFATSETGKALVGLVEKGEKFGTLYIDPPWKAGAGSKYNTNIPAEYSTMTHQQLLDMGKTVDALAADDAHLFLWALSGNLPNALEYMKACGFTYKSNLIWVKPTPTNLGSYFGTQHEHLLVGIKGKPKEFGGENAPSSIFSCERAKHSRKPDGIRKIINATSTGDKIELFAREINADWVSWGNELKDEGYIYDAREPLAEKIDPAWGVEKKKKAA